MQKRKIKENHELCNCNCKRLDAKETINILMSTFLQTTDSTAATNCLETETKSKHAKGKLFAIQVVEKI